MIRSISILVCALVCASAASAQVVTGTVAAREAATLPATAVVEVTLEDVSRADAPAVAMATTRIDRPGTLPVSYTLRFVTTAIHPARRYAVRARIFDRDQLMFTSFDAYPVLTQGHGVTADILVRQVASAAPPPSNPAMAPRGEVPGPAAPVARATAVAAPPTLDTLPASFIGTLPCDGCAGTRAHLNLFPDDSFFLKLADQGRPNVVDDMGSWAASSDGTLVVLQGRTRTYQFVLRDATSMRALDERGAPTGTAGRNDLRRAARFQPLEVRLEMQGAFRRLGTVSLFTECATGRTWEVAADGAASQLASSAGDGQLVTLEGRVAEVPRDAGAAPMLHVDRVVGPSEIPTCAPRFAAAPLVRTNWRLMSLGAGDAPVSPGGGLPYLVFDDNTRRFSGAGGCNRVVGAYDVNGSGIALAVAGTMTACPEGDAERRFTAALEAAARYRIAGRDLVLFDADGAVLARFQADGTR